MGETKIPPLEKGLVMAMKALDSQIARAMERSPKEREEHGVQKWEPHRRKIEEVSSVVVNAFAEQEAGLDGLLVLAQAYVKSLYMVASELEEDGLGEVRASYIESGIDAMERDLERMRQVLTTNKPRLN